MAKVYETIIYETKNRWATITLNRPEVKNALSEVMTNELTSAFEDIRNDTNIRGLAIRGSNGAFCAGADLKDFKNNFVLKKPTIEEVKDMNVGAGLLFKSLSQLPKIVVALVDGPAYAGGLGMVCCADIVAVTGTAKFSLSETAIGLTPAQISPYLIKRLGLRIASKLMLTGLEFGAKDSYEIGLADEVVENNEGLDGFFQNLQDQTKKCAPKATAATKEILSYSRDARLEDLSEFAAKKFAECMIGEEAKEGLVAFSEKRKPYWYEN
jgi:isohexenylglutaconyl-CoA hydratase